MSDQILHSASQQRKIRSIGSAARRRSALRARQSRRRGISLLLFAALFPLIMLMCAMVIDIGSLYAARAQAQRAADAAALAGAITKGQDGSTDDMVVAAGVKYASLNFYSPTDGKRPATVVITPNYSSSTTTGGYTNTVRAYVQRKESVYFAPILGGLLRAMGYKDAAVQYTNNVSAAANATLDVTLPLSGGGPYGIADPNKSPSNTSVFGPYAYYNFGDPNSTMFLQNGSPNPRYAQTQGYSNFRFTVNNNFHSADGKVHFQIFDPDCYSPGGVDKYDEIRDPNTNIKSTPVNPGGKKATTTTYQLVGPNGQDVPGATATYSDDPATDNKWIDPPNFDVDPIVSGYGQYTLRVKATDGSSENGFLLRAGPSEGLTMTDDQWNQTYGDKGGTSPGNVMVPMEALDHLQMNFTNSGSVKFQLGYIGPDEAGSTIGVTHFDVDVGSKTIVYTCDKLPGQSFSGFLPSPGDGVWYTDKITLPSDYAGGNWYAQYVAGAGDTSSWELSGTGKGSGTVRLTE